MKPRASFVITALSIATSAHAQPSDPPIDHHDRDVASAAASDPRSAADVAGAPVPGDESGRVDAASDEDAAGRRVARVALVIPKVALQTVLIPVRGSLWMYDHYDLEGLYRRFFTVGSIAVTPTFSIESGDIYGLTAGLRLVDRNVFGAHERIAAQAVLGTARYRELFSIGLRSGDRLGERVRVEADASYERRPHDRFYGIGNGDLVAPPMPDIMIDPRASDAAIETSFQQARTHVALVADVTTWNALRVRVAGAWTRAHFGAGDRGAALDSAYAAAHVPSYTSGLDELYGEGEARWDDRRAVGAHEPRAVYDGGWLASAFLGRAHRLDVGRDYWRYGVDVAHFVRLAAGPRVLALRVHGEAVTGSRDDVPFDELPRLGGAAYLRGYPLDRFRDRVAALATAQYEWDLAAVASAKLFVDVGRVYSSLDALAFAHPRVGYGVALEAHSQDNFVAEVSVASSIDGGLYVSLVLNPVFDIDDRVRRNR